MTTLKKALEHRRNLVLDHPFEYEWYTEWELIEIENSVIIGGIMLMPERKNGEVEIGYGIEQQYQNKGYMTEAVTPIINWIFDQFEETKYVVAETEFVFKILY